MGLLVGHGTGLGQHRHDAAAHLGVASTGDGHPAGRLGRGDRDRGRCGAGCGAADHPGQVAEVLEGGHRLLAAQVEDLPGRGGPSGGRHDAVEEVVDVDRREEAPTPGRQQHPTRADRLERLQDPRSTAGSVHVGRADDRAGLAAGGVRGQHQVLGRDLGVGVGVAGRHQRPPLVELPAGQDSPCRGGVGVGEARHAHGRDLHEALGARAGRGVEHPLGADDVDLPRPFGGDVVGHDRGGVDHHRTRGDGVGPTGRVEDVAGDDAAVGIGRDVDTGHVDPRAAVALGQRPAHEAVGAGHEHRGGRIVHVSRCGRSGTARSRSGWR